MTLAMWPRLTRKTIMGMREKTERARVMTPIIMPPTRRLTQQQHLRTTAILNEDKVWRLSINSERSCWLHFFFSDRPGLLPAARQGCIGERTWNLCGGGGRLRTRMHEGIDGRCSPEKGGRKITAAAQTMAIVSNAGGRWFRIQFAQLMYAWCTLK